MHDLSSIEQSYLDQHSRLDAVARLQPVLNEPSEAFDTLAALAADIANTPIALISLIDADRQRFIGMHGTDLGSTARDVALCARVVATKSDLVVNDALASELHAGNPLVAGSFGLRAYAGVPLLLDGHNIGAVCAIDHSPRPFSSDCLARLRTLATAVGTLIEARTAKPEPVSAQVDTLHKQALNATGHAVLVTDLESRVIWANSATRQMFSSDDPVGLQLETVTGNSGPADNRVESRHINERVAPLIDPENGKVVGTIHTFADITVGEIQRLRLERLVNTEWLTGIDNRRSFETQLIHEIDLFGKGTPTGPVMIGILDLDRFKAVNDRLGHAVGDEVLVEVAECIRDEVAALGTVARLGGDEFALLLHDCDVPAARVVADEILHAIGRSMASRDDVRRHLSASIGFATLGRDDRSPGDVLLRADAACYQAKKAGGACARFK